MATETTTLQTRKAEILAPGSTIAGTVYAVSRGFNAGTITVQVSTPHGITSIALCCPGSQPARSARAGAPSAR